MDNYFFCLPVNDKTKSLMLDGNSMLMAHVWQFRTAEEMQAFTANTEKETAQVNGYRILLAFHHYLDIPAAEANTVLVKKNLQVMADVYLKYKIQPNEKSYNRYRTAAIV